MAEKKTTTAKKTAAKVTDAKAAETVQNTAKTPAEELFTREEVNRMITEAVKTALGNMQPQTIQVKQEEEMIHLRYQNEVMGENIVRFGDNGEWGQITGKSGDVWVPKKDWSRFCNAIVRRMLDKRTLIVVSGFSDEEMEMLNISYKRGEVLDDRVFNKLLDMGDALVSIYPNLCQSNKDIIAKRFVTAFESGDKRVYNRTLITKLNKLSKVKDDKLPKDDPRRKGAFAKILEGMNAEEADED